MKKILSLTLCAAALLAAASSCGIYSKYKPVETVATDLYGERGTALADTTDCLAALSWREFFADPALQSLIEQALTDNTDLRIAALRVEEAEASLRTAKLAYLPSFALTPQGTLSSFDGGTPSKTYQIPVSASWEVDLFGRLRNAKRQARAQLEQSRDYEQAVRTQLVASIANAYYTLQMLDAQLRISEATEQSWRASVASTRALMEAGMTHEAAVAQMEAAWYSVQSSVVDLRRQISEAESSLCKLLATSPHAVARHTWEEAPFRAPATLATGVPARMLDARPDVRAAERSLEAAYYGTAAARSAFYPSLTITGLGGWTNSAGLMVVNPGKAIVTGVAALTQPLFAQGKLSAQLKVAKAEQEAAALTFQQTLLNAGAEVGDALVACQSCRDKRDLIDAQVLSLQKAYESTSLLMQHGNITYLDVLTAQQSLLSAQLQQAAHRCAEVQGFITLYHALGGGGDTVLTASSSR